MASKTNVLVSVRSVEDQAEGTNFKDIDGDKEYLQDPTS